MTTIGARTSVRRRFGGAQRILHEIAGTPRVETSPVDDIGDAFAIAARQMAINAATVEVVQALERQGIRAILLKGAAIAARLYDDPTDRPYRDPDLLVAPGMQQLAENVVASLGFRDLFAEWRRTERARNSSTWERVAATQVFIELHVTMVWCEQEPEAVWAELSPRVHQIDVSGSPVAVLGDPAQALVIAGHAIQHFGAARPTEDLERALVRISHESWLEASSIAWRLSLDPRKRRTTGMKKGMEESYVEDLANRDGPAHALVSREGAAKRWCRGRAGR